MIRFSQAVSGFMVISFARVPGHLPGGLPAHLPGHGGPLPGQDLVAESQRDVLAAVRRAGVPLLPGLPAHPGRPGPRSVRGKRHRRGVPPPRCTSRWSAGFDGSPAAHRTPERADLPARPRLHRRLRPGRHDGRVRRHHGAPAPLVLQPAGRLLLHGVVPRRPTPCWPCWRSTAATNSGSPTSSHPSSATTSASSASASPCSGPTSCSPSSW